MSMKHLLYQRRSDNVGKNIKPQPILARASPYFVDPRASYRAGVCVHEDGKAV